MAEKEKKRFKPSQRERKRYLIIVTDRKHNLGLVRQIAGEHGINLKVIGFNEKESKAMVCVLRKHLATIRNALKNRGFNLIGVSGTIKRAGQKWMNG